MREALFGFLQACQIILSLGTDNFWPFSFVGRSRQFGAVASGARHTDSYMTLLRRLGFGRWVNRVLA